MAGLSTRPAPPGIRERRSIALSRPSPGVVVQAGEHGFMDDLSRLYDPAESNAAEQLVDLKNVLRTADTDSFWSLLTKGLASIADAQYAFVSRRILVDEKDAVVEMPPVGQPESCLMGEAFYINDDLGNGPGLIRNFKYHAYHCPCAYMRHGKVFVIPERLNEFIVNNPNDLIIPGEAYLGIPLLAEGKCFAHFGVMWGKEGAARRTLSWGFLETLLHALEDMILERLLEGDEFAGAAHVVQKGQPIVVPHKAVSVAQSLKPYARSLSHELRTPMQGVVGMLDVMMANVKEASETMDIDERTRLMLDTLKENIEAVQDSSRRAVEAADNVVHAYDMNMGVPEAPVSPLDKSPGQWNPFWPEPRLEFARPEYLADDTNQQQRGVKRRREDLPRHESQTRVVRHIRRRTRDTFSQEPPVRGAISCPPQVSSRDIEKLESCQDRCSSSTSFPKFVAGHQKTPSLRQTNVREVLHYVITDALKVGGRPDSAIAEAIDNGERIEVRTRSSNGEAFTKWVEWRVSPDVPDSILIDEKDLAKVVSCVTLNAIKFTQNGTITLETTLSAKGRCVVINIKDTGSGIPAAFLPNLFKPFSREDDSTTRQSEGLGLGLMVAKGLARKLGGDLFCLRSHVTGSKKGSEFELRVPLTAGEVCSRPSSPFGSPTPPIRARMSVDSDVHHLDVDREPITPPLSSEPFVGEPHQVPVAGLHTPTVIVHTVPSSNVLGLLSPRRTSSPLHLSSKEPAKKLTPVPKLAEELPLNILAVDDNSINRRVLQNMLNRLGYKNVQIACNGLDAIEVMHRNSFAPASEAIDLVLMDLWMPYLDGFQATTSILRMPELVENGRTPTILAVTADVTDAALDKAASSGMKGYVTKPFVTRDLVRLIRTYCATRES